MQYLKHILLSNLTPEQEKQIQKDTNYLIQNSLNKKNKINMTNYDKLLKTLKDEISYLETYIKEKRQEIKETFDKSFEGRERYRYTMMYFEGKESVLMTLKSIVKNTEKLNK